jgi:CRISPR-associated endonuclease/helicase Cas3
VRRPFTTFWGKLRGVGSGGSEIEWHPLVDHCSDVAAVAGALLDLPLWRARFETLECHELDAVSRARLCVLVALHDIGKFNIGFQAKGRTDLGPSAGHVREALGALFRGGSCLACLHRELPSWGDSVTGLLVAALCHHGRPYNVDSPQDALWQASWWMPRGNLDPAAGVEDLLSRCRTWFPLAFEIRDSRLPVTAGFSHAFAGLVMLADWIGSDPRFFPFTEPRDGDRMEFARPRARQALAALGLDVPVDIRKDSTARNPFERVAPYRPRAMQAAMLELPCEKTGSITVLESETGSGKTEAILARFVTLFEAGLVDGLYFALPTRSAATEMHRRVFEAARRAFAIPPAVVLAVPGYLRVDDVEGKKLAPFEVLWPDQDRFRYRAWAAEAPKRYLAGTIVVGTVDQVLLSSLMVGHTHLRASALLRHLLVVDEVHASDAYMTAILESVIERHFSAGGHAILLSATLGCETRERLLNPGGHRASSRVADAVDTAYPLITFRGPTERSLPVANEGVERRVVLHTRPWLEDVEVVAHEALAAAQRGAKVLLVRNTVADCVRTQIAVERAAAAKAAHDVLFACNGQHAPHHARFARPDRLALDRALAQQLGKVRPEGGRVVIATQTVQQSLDLDADILFSDLCPADVLLQRIGRLHRHSRQRPDGFRDPVTFVLTPKRRDLLGLLINERGDAGNYHGLGRVYPDLRILEATWRLIEAFPNWVLPRMNRMLVEQSVHSHALQAIVEQGGDRWRAHSIHVIGAQRGHQRLAQLNLVDGTKSYAETSFSSVMDQRITTRLGEGDRRLRFAPPVEGPFGNLVDELTLRPWWVAGLSSDTETAEDVSVAERRVRFRAGPRAFVYDRLGLQADRPVSTDPEEDDGP